MDKLTRQEITNTTMSNFWNIREDLKGKSLDEIKHISYDTSLPFAVCALNITGDLNIGIMIRSAVLMGARHFFIYGVDKYDRRTTVGSHNYIEIVKIKAFDKETSEIDYTDFFPTLKQYGYKPVFFDTGGIMINKLDMKETCDPTNGNPCLVFGNEGLGIPKELTNNQQIITIPQRGVLRSLNVSAAASIAIHHFSIYLENL